MDNITLDYEYVIMLSASVLWTCGDLIAQVIERRQIKKDWDFARTARLASFAFLVFAPLTSRWFVLLETIFPGDSLQVGFQRMACDQLFYAPFIIGASLYWVSVCENWSVSEAFAKVRADLFPTLKMNWMIWPAVQFFNMSMVPVDLRIFVGSFVSVPWTAYLSWQASKKVAPGPAKIADNV